MRGPSGKTKSLIKYARALLAANHPMTLRQLHYAIFSRGEIDYRNDQASYRRLSRVTTFARRADRQWQIDGLEDSPYPEHGIPADWIVDETRAPEAVNCWADAEAYMRTVERSYRRDNWRLQPYHVEIWSEKATILGSIRPIADKWGMTMRVLHGFGSTGMEQSVAEYFASIEKWKWVLYLGDHDPSGRLIERDIQKRIKAAGAYFDIERMAIHEHDIHEFNLPPQRIKATDTRSRSFRQEYGDDAATVELDALPPDELRRRLDDRISDLVNHEQWERDTQVMEAEAATIRSITAKFRELREASP